MRESIAGISLTMIVITLILLFAGIMSLTISRSNAIAVKDRIMRTIEEYDGFDMSTSLSSYDTDCKGTVADNKKALCDILDTINTYSYRQTGNCPKASKSVGEVAGFQRDGKAALSSGKAAFCVVRTKAAKRDKINRYYYKVIVFYGIDMPVINTILKFTATGETKMLYN